MGITTASMEIELLKFALRGVDLLAWPAIALCYPLFASIRAVETGSNYHMRKLVMYWTIFSLFSLFEFAFVKIIELIPFWSSMRLVIIIWLVMPRFEGACLAYQGLVHLLVKLKDGRLSIRQTLLNVGVIYMKEYDSRPLEKATASEVQHERSNSSDPVQTLPLEEIQQERTCDLCEITTMSESMLNAHLRGRKHKSKLEFLKASLLDSKDTGPSHSVHQKQSVRYPKGIDTAPEVKETMPSKEITETRCLKNLPPKIEWRCDLCKVTATSKNDLNAHLRGSKHKSNIESSKASGLGAQQTGFSLSGTSKSNHGKGEEKCTKENGSESEKLSESKVKVQHAKLAKSVWIPKGTDAFAEVNTGSWDGD